MDEDQIPAVIKCGRLGRAGLIYLHATRERDQKIGAGMGKLFADAKKTSNRQSSTRPKPSATQRARSPKRASSQRCVNQRIKALTWA